MEKEKKMVELTPSDLEQFYIDRFKAWRGKSINTYLKRLQAKLEKWNGKPAIPMNQRVWVEDYILWKEGIRGDGLHMYKTEAFLYKVYVAMVEDILVFWEEGGCYGKE